MDRGRRPAALAAVLAAAALAASDTPPLAEMRWLAPGADAVAALGQQPSECFQWPTLSAGELTSIGVGRAAFRSPLLLGGQAARTGLSCETCHRNGRTNPDFQFPGVSGPPGTADVTSSLFSSHRGNGVDDPKPIPDLGGPRAALKVDHDPRSKALETFIRGLITEEFDGPEPTPAVLAGLAAYIRTLDPAACSSPKPLRADDYLGDALSGVIAAHYALEAKDPATALVMVAAARARLGRLDERFVGLPRSLAALRKSNADLMRLERMIRASDPRALARIRAWTLAVDGLAVTLRRDEPRSLFNPERLAAAARLPRQGL
ncbi:MAG: hypothetical protein Q8L23_11525 [Caulobacter sp.]|nr:hypothetical protein [Caulobacter sp.]